MTKELFSTKEAAEYLGRSQNAVKMLIKKKKLRVLDCRDRRLVISRDELERFSGVRRLYAVTSSAG